MGLPVRWLNSHTKQASYPEPRWHGITCALAKQSHQTHTIPRVKMWLPVRWLNSHTQQATYPESRWRDYLCAGWTVTPNRQHTQSQDDVITCALAEQSHPTGNIPRVKMTWLPVRWLNSHTQQATYPESRWQVITCALAEQSHMQKSRQYSDP